MNADPHHSVQHIRRRLWLLLIQAFGTVVLLTVVLLLALFGIIVIRSPNFETPLANGLQSYYLGRNGWDGVEALVTANSSEFFQVQWNEAILLDADGRVLIDHGRWDTPLVGQPYTPEPGDPAIPLTVNGARVGTLVLKSTTGLRLPERSLLALLLPVSILSFFLAVLTVLIGLLLVRRVVTPLAEVIAATQQVAAGDLAARVSVNGPGDLRGLSEGFNQMAGALQRSDAERRNLLADVAHELRTPLSVMRGRLEGIIDGVYPMAEAQIGPVIGPVLESTYLLERLVDDLRLLTLAEARQLQFDRRLIDLGELARQAASVFEAEAGERNIALSVQAEPDLPQVNADPQRVSQVIGNLVSNALRHAPVNGAVRIQVRRVENGVELTVVDNGPGVPEADLPRIFDRFWRGERSRTRAAGGAGLGLAIAKQLIEAQGGAITASAAPGGGLRIAFVLPE